MPVTWSLGSHWKFRHPGVLLAAVIGTAIIAATIWMFSIYNSWNASVGPFLEFEIRLPPGILLPADNHIEVTFWSDGVGRGCRGLHVRRSVDPPEIAGRCRIMGYGKEHILSMRLSRYAEGYWKMPIGWNIDRDPAFGPWLRIEYSRAPAGEREVSSLPYGEYHFRYLIRP